MKKRYIVAAPILALLAFAGCTPDEEPTVTSAASEAADVGAEVGTPDADDKMTEAAEKAAEGVKDLAATETAAEPEPTTEEPTAEEPAEPTTEEPASNAGGSDGVVSLGETYKWSDGTEVTITQGGEFTPTEWASGGEGFDSHLLFTVSVTNNSSAPMDLGMAMSSVQSGTGEGDQVFDVDQDLGGSPFTTLLPGRTVEWSEGYGVMDTSDIVFQFAPSWDHETRFWTN